MYKFFKDQNERLTFIIFILSLILFVISLFQPPIIIYFDVGLLGIFLKSGGINTISAGIVSAYILYIFVELKPRYEKERKTLKVLDQAIASIVEGFFYPNSAQHEKSIKHTKFNLKESEKEIVEYIEKIKTSEVPFARLKIVMETAISRYPDFQNLLTLTVNLSPKHALYWLDLTDKIHLIAEAKTNEKYNVQILNDFLSKSYEIKNPSQEFYSDLQLRVLEFFESIVDWNRLNQNEYKEK